MTTAEAEGAVPYGTAATCTPATAVAKIASKWANRGAATAMPWLGTLTARPAQQLPLAWPPLPLPGLPAPAPLLPPPPQQWPAVQLPCCCRPLPPPPLLRCPHLPCCSPATGRTLPDQQPSVHPGPLPSPAAGTAPAHHRRSRPGTEHPCLAGGYGREVRAEEQESGGHSWRMLLLWLQRRIALPVSRGGCEHACVVWTN